MGYVFIVITVIIVILYLLKLRSRDPRDIPGIPKPAYNASLHIFSAEAINDGKEAYEKAIKLNKDNPNKEIVVEYASLAEELVKFGSMYLSSSDLGDVSEIEKRALYWAAWCQEYMKKTNDMAEKYGLISSDESDQ